MPPSQQEHSDHVTKDQRSKKKAFSFKKFLIKSLVVLFLSSFFTVICFKALLEPWLKEQIQLQVQDTTRGIYNIKVDDLDINIFTSTIDLQDIKIIRDSALASRIAPKAFAIQGKIDRILLEDVKWIRFLKTDSLQISHFRIISPDLYFDTFASTPKNHKKTDQEVRDLKQQITNVVLKNSPEFDLRMFTIEHAQLNWHKHDKGKILTRQLQDFTIMLDEILVNQSTALDPNRWFFAKTVNLDIKDFRYAPSLGQSIIVDHTSLGTRDSTLHLRGATFRDHDKQIHCADITLNDISLSKLYFHKKLSASTLHIQDPSINWKGKSKKKIPKDLHLKYDIQRFVQQKVLTKLSNVQVGKAIISDGFLSFENTRSLRVLTHKINHFDIKLDSIRLDSNTRDFLFCKKIKLTLKDYRLSSSDKTLNARLDSLSFDNRHTKVSRFSLKSPKADIQVPKLRVQNHNFNTYWHRRVLPIQLLSIYHPKVHLKGASRKGKADKQLIPKFIGRFADKIYISKIQITDGDYLSQKNIDGQTVKQGAKKINVVFNPVTVDASDLQSHPLEKIVSQLKYATSQKVKLQGPNASMSLANVYIQPQKRPFLHVDAFVLDSPKAKAEVDALEISTVDWSAYWTKREILIDDILISQPNLQLTSNKKKNKFAKAIVNSWAKLDSLHMDSLQTKKHLRHILQEQVLQYCDKFYLENLTIKEGTVQHSAKAIQQSVEGLNIHLNHIVISPEIDPDSASVLFSDTIALSLSQYKLQPKDQSYSLVFKDFSVTNTDASLHLDEVIYEEGDNAFVKIPQLSAHQIDWQKLWQSEKIEVQKIALKAPLLTFDLSKLSTKTQDTLTVQKTNKLTEQLFFERVQKISKGVKIDTLLLDEGKLSLIAPLANKKKILHQIDSIKVVFLNVDIDSSNIDNPQKILFSDEISMRLKNYELLNPDRDMELKVREIFCSSTDSTLIVEDIALEDLTGLQKKIYLPNTKAIHISLRDFIKRGRLQVQELYIKQPQLDFFKDNTKVALSQLFKKKKRQSLNHTLATLNIAESFGVDTLRIDKGKLTYRTKKLEGISQQYVNNIDLRLSNISLDSSILGTPKALGFADAIQIDADSISIVQTDSLYTFEVKALHLRSDDSTLIASDLHYRPLKSIEQVMRSQPYYKSRFNIFVESLNAKQVDLPKLFIENQFVVSNLTIDDVLFSVSDDARIAKDPMRRPQFPNHLVRKLPLYVGIDTITVRNMDLYYQESVLRGRSKGKIKFNNTNAFILNLTNDSLRMSNEKPLDLWVSTLFMNEGVLNLRIKIPLLSDKEEMQFYGELGEMSAHHINHMIAPIAHVMITNGTLKKIKFNGFMKNNVVQGSMLAIYRKLKVEVMEEEKHKRRGMITTAANLLLNQTNKKKRANILYFKDSTDGFVKILWQSIASGLKNTMLPKIINRTQKK